MSETKWTPGPWLLQHTAEPGIAADVSGDGGRIGSLNHAGRVAKVTHIPESWGNAQANANLISAAPDMAEALEHLIDMISNVDNRERLLAALPSARAALRRARGEV